jgi:putative SOS response-associated peptidase YedK
MCSRYSLTSPPEAIRGLFQCSGEVDFPPRYNIAPTDPALIVRSSAAQVRELYLVRWGLIPPWVKDPREFATLINARAETAADKPSFRGALRHRRCLVPTDGFYEWTGRPGSKQPHLIRMKTHAPFALAGLWEHWLGADGSELETMAILTTSANSEMDHLHDRMPVILEPAHWDRWLDCRPGSADHIMDLLRPLPPGQIETLAVNPKLNNPRAEGPELQDASILR